MDLFPCPLHTRAPGLWPSPRPRQQQCMISGLCVQGSFACPCDDTGPPGLSPIPGPLIQPPRQRPLGLRRPHVHRFWRLGGGHRGGHYWKRPPQSNLVLPIASPNAHPSKPTGVFPRWRPAASPGAGGGARTPAPACRSSSRLWAGAHGKGGWVLDLPTRRCEWETCRCPPGLSAPGHRGLVLVEGWRTPGPATGTGWKIRRASSTPQPLGAAGKCLV